jgi:hypothetical protein
VNDAQPRLPLWRAISGFAILALFVLVMAMLAPYFVENSQLTRYVRSLPAADSDEKIRSEVIAQAHALGLPVESGDIKIKRDGGRLRLETRYVVRNLSFYPVDLHLQANSR